MVKLIYHGPGVRAFGEWMNDGDTGEYKETAAAILLRHPEFEVVHEPSDIVVPLAEPEPKPKAKRIGKRAAKGKAK